MKLGDSSFGNIIAKGYILISVGFTNKGICEVHPIAVIQYVVATFKAGKRAAGEAVRNVIVNGFRDYIADFHPDETFGIQGKGGRISSAGHNVGSGKLLYQAKIVIF